MALVVPFGQYLPGTTPVHTTDGRVKIIIMIAYTIAIFTISSWPAMAVLALVMLAGYLIGRIPLRVALRGLKPLLYILIFTVIVNSFTFDAAAHAGALPLIGSFAFKPDGCLLGLYFALRICLLVLGTSLITFSTSAVKLADCLTSLMKPLRILHVPVDDIATMFSIALRFIPLTAEEADGVKTAQAARGVVFDKGNVLSRAKAWIPVLVPLFVNLFRRADELACAMETRCYTGEGRTRLDEPRMSARDWVVLIVLSCGFIALGVLW